MSLETQFLDDEERYQKHKDVPQMTTPTKQKTGNANGEMYNSEPLSDFTLVYIIGLSESPRALDDNL